MAPEIYQPIAQFLVLIVALSGVMLLSCLVYLLSILDSGGRYGKSDRKDTR